VSTIQVMSRLVNLFQHPDTYITLRGRGIERRDIGSGSGDEAVCADRMLAPQGRFPLGSGREESLGPVEL
jgi:hypothetical protein